jgi:hypothetical protein
MKKLEMILQKSVDKESRRDIIAITCRAKANAE